MMFTCDDSCTSVTFACKLDQKSKSAGGGKQVSAMNMFKMMDKKGAVSNDGDAVQTKHKNAILQVINNLFKNACYIQICGHFL